MAKKILGIVLLLTTLGCNSFFPNPSSDTPRDFDNSILIRETMTAMGAKTVTTVYKDGRVQAISDFPGMAGSYKLNKDKINQIQTLLVEAGFEIRTFNPKPNIMYEGTYKLETNYQRYISHTSSDEELEKITKLISESKPSKTTKK